MSRKRVLVISKAPVPGRSKSRLVPPLSQEQAARLAEAMLLDTFHRCQVEADEVGLLCPNAEDARALAALVGPDVPIVVQQGGGLRDALQETLRAATPDGPVAIVSSDIPGVPAGAIAAAHDALTDADVVLGPSLDGGYWLIAMARFNEAPFVDIPWSTPACLAVTRRRILDAGLRLHLLDTWIDIDTSVDLSLAVHDPPGPLGVRTTAVLEAIRDELDIPPPPALRLRHSDVMVSTPWRSVIHDLLDRGEADAQYTYLAVPRAVFVVAVTTQGEVLLVRQYRHPVRDWTLEVPAGAVEDGEQPLDAARRELAEEAGGIGGSWRHLSSFFSSSAHLSLRSDAFLVTDVQIGLASPEPGEDLALVRMPVADALAAARAGRMVEGQTALALLLAAPYLEALGST